MENIRLVPASLHLCFEEGTIENDVFMKEYYSLLTINDNPLSVWLKSAKIRKESEQTDQVLLTLLIDLHNKIDTLTHKLTSTAPLHVPLAFTGVIDAIGHEHIALDKECLEEGKRYYGRVDMPTFPRRHMALFFEALSPKIGKIILMHEDDENDWSAYIAACERVMIRQMKGHTHEY